MGLATHFISLTIGAYVGAYATQNYEVPKVPSPCEIQKKIEQYVEQYRKSE